MDGESRAPETRLLSWSKSTAQVVAWLATRACGAERLPVSFVGALARVAASHVPTAEAVTLWFHRQAASAEPRVRGGYR